MSNGVKTLHPDITTQRREDWALMAAAFDGEGAIKAAAKTYLPMPSGFLAQSDKGVQAYDNYKNRAQFPEIVASSIGGMVGIVHAKDAQIELPSALEHLRENADGKGMSLEAFHRMVTRYLLKDGRYGILADAPPGAGDVFLSGYLGAAIINWDTDFFVLDETHNERDGFDWGLKEQYRVLALEEGFYVQDAYAGTERSERIEPRGTGRVRLTEIPFAVANARDLKPDVLAPPLIGVAQEAVAQYQLSADLRHQLYMSGQETLLAINGEAPSHVGAGVVHEMHGTDTQTPDLKYVGPSCTGIEAHERAIKDSREAAVIAGARMFEQSGRVQESGEARALRFASETASLVSVALSSYGLLERALKNAALLAGAKPDDVTVAKPDELLSKPMTPADAEALVRIWQAGGLSYGTVYERLQAGKIANPDRSVEDELAQMDSEETGGTEGP